MKNALIYLILCFVLAPAMLLSQDYIIKNFNRKNGLPSNNIYSITQDKQGLLWIATETGICTFNGKAFNLNPIPELADEEIIQVYLDSHYRLWLIELTGDIYLFHDGILRTFKSELIQNQVLGITEDPKGNIWIKAADKNKEIAFDANKLALKYAPNSESERIDIFRKILESLTEFQIRQDLKENEAYYKLLGIETKFTPSSNFYFFDELVILKDGNWIFEVDNRIYFFNTKIGTIKQVLTEYNDLFDAGIERLKLDNQDNLWIAKNTGVMLVKNVFSNQPEVRHFLDDVRVGTFHLDLNENLWVNTQQSGIYMFSQKRIQAMYQNKKECVTSIFKNKDHLVYGTLDGEVVILNNQFEEVKRIKLEDNRERIYKLEEYEENKILAVSTKIIELIDLTNFTTTNFLSEGFFKNATKDTFETIWINGGKSNYIYDDLVKDLNITDLKGRSYSCLPLDKNSAFYGTPEGLYRVNKSNEIQKMLGDDFNKDIRHISQGSDSTFLLSTHGDGIYIISNDSIDYHLSELLPSRNIRKTIYIDNAIWVASNSGLSKVQNQESEFTCKTIGRTDGLPSCSVIDIYSFEDKIYCATENGIGVIDKEVKFDEHVPVLQIDKVKINERDTSLLTDYELNIGQNNIQISFNSIHYNNPGAVRYKYKLSGLNIDWTETDQTFAQYPSLPAGKYKFLVRTKSLNSNWGSSQSINFDIPSRFVDTITFQLLRAILIAGAAIFVYNLAVKNRERKRALKVSQLMALRTQMNPHFIFNSLNSVQDYILNDDKRAANKYISQFSKLMRYTLNTSEHEFTDLNLELDALKLYLSIESMRFDNSLIYNINIAPGVDPKKYQIPTMIIQPFVENAIKHGLIHAKGEKSLNINVDKMEKGLYFEVIDNGIGRVHSRKLNSNNLEKHDPKGTLIIQKRIELLNKSYKSENKVAFEDIYNQEGNPTGTKVKIVLQSIKFTK